MKKLVSLALLLGSLSASAFAAPASFGSSVIASDGTEAAWTKYANIAYTSATVPTSVSTITYSVVPRGALKVYAYTTSATGIPFKLMEVGKNGEVFRTQTVTATTTGALVADFYDPIGFSKVQVSPTTAPTGQDSVSITAISAVPRSR